MFLKHAHSHRLSERSVKVFAVDLFCLGVSVCICGGGGGGGGGEGIYIC